MPFDSLIPTARQFLTELDANNSRDWFLANKDRYDADLKAPSLALLDVVAADLERLTGLPVTPKLFRPQRDIRFSKDKTPYKTHLHMLWDCGTAGRKTAFYFGVELDRVVMGGGCMGMDKEKLMGFRRALDSTKGPALQDAIARATAQGVRFSEPELKRVPAPFPAEHPLGELLRHKSLTFWSALDDQPDDQPIDLPAALSAGFATLMPMQDWLLDL